MSDLVAGGQVREPPARAGSGSARATPIATWVALAVTLASAAAAGAMMLGGDAHDMTTRAARFTARVSFAFFLVVFMTSTLARLAPRPITRALMRQRRAAGLAFAAAHGVHALYIAAAIVAGGVAFGAPSDAVAALGYVFVALLAATSNDASVRRLGPGAWRRLHTVGTWVLWLIFFLAYAYRAPEHPVFAAPAGLLALAAALKIGSRLRLPRAAAT